MTLTKQKIYLSPPHMSGLEQRYVQDAFETNWIAPLGSNRGGSGEAEPESAGPFKPSR